MSVAVFDAHAFVKRFTAVGMPEAQAGVLADEQVRLVDDRLATKADIAQLAVATKADIAELAADIAQLGAASKAALAQLAASTKSDLAETKADILKWLFGTIGFQTLVVLGAVFASVKLIHA
jgi:hypothetical protein